MEVTTLIVDKCKYVCVALCVHVFCVCVCVVHAVRRYMSSKKVPLWLVFNNADQNSEAPVSVLFKSGCVLFFFVRCVVLFVHVLCAQ